MSSSIPFRSFNRPIPDISIAQTDDGSWIVKSNIPLGEYLTNIGTYFRRAAAEYPERPFLVQCRPEGDWPELTYQRLQDEADQVSSYLLANGYGPEKSIMIMSGNSFSHAILKVAALQVGVPVTACSPSYSLMGPDFSKLQYALELTEPG